MIKFIKFLIFAFLILACGDTTEYDHKGVNADSDSVMTTNILDSAIVNQMTIDKLDSLEFRLTHHYTINDNFVVTADSLKLVPREDETTDTCVVHKNDILVVVKVKRNYRVKPDSLDLSNADANLLRSMEEANEGKGKNANNILAANDTLPSDSLLADTVWIKVAGSQYSMGWVTESALLSYAVPNDNISILLNSLTNTRLLWMGGLLALGLLGLFLHKKYNNRNLKVVRISEMDSFYPFLFITLIALLACWYVSIQNFAPEFWQEFYFHPTLNPFLLPPVMAALVVLVWLIIIVFIALIIEIYNNFKFLRGFVYLIEILGASMFVYLIISWTTKVYIGYVLFIVLTWFLWVMYNGFVKCRFKCGNCGHKLKEKGKCPNCGAIVE